ncbi:MAG TPA: hypothetical protein DDZ83_17105 [Nitrospinae bacterium]|nr:hypothetical protein [Nitrospinota bacterium]
MESNSDRRSFLRTGLTAFGGLLAAMGSRMGGDAEAAHTKMGVGSKKHKVVYHLSSRNWKHAMFNLGNIKNHMKGVGGPRNLDVHIVVHGPALPNFTKKKINKKLKARLETLQLDGLKFGACGNTMKRFKITMDQLPQGAIHVPQGGVVRLAELQEQGYVYLRP